eukprot:c17740_g1_i1.p1 GENE.c17740_g1_i1~~c17740_g1_i1.p1  ORF type:complete len:408 (+),score=69.70 c17740_g1_i1:48-1271(+)
MQSVMSVLNDLYLFYSAFSYFLFGGALKHCPYFRHDEHRHTRIHIFSLALIFRLWSAEHYRSGTFQNDKLKNLRNVAFPGTGIPLSLFCHFKLTAYVGVLIFYPICALIAAARFGNFAKSFHSFLLAPDNWFSFWRLNCRMVSYHHLVTREPQYEFEDKWTFLKQGQEAGLPVTPFFKCNSIIVKHRNEEGGLGLKKYNNATTGGDWIIQEWFENSAFLRSLLPSNAPLSTFRIITTSRGLITDSPTPADNGKDMIKALSCVFRAGRQNAITDHSSVLFDVDMNTGEILNGSYNWNWYQLGLKGLWCPWSLTSAATTTHPDAPHICLTGVRIPEFQKMLDLVVKAHGMFPQVPICGWDVALTDNGMYLLETNFSCNFFQATFDKPAYFQFVEDVFLFLESKEQRRAT